MFTEPVDLRDLEDTEEVVLALMAAGVTRIWISYLGWPTPIKKEIHYW